MVHLALALVIPKQIKNKIENIEKIYLCGFSYIIIKDFILWNSFETDDLKYLDYMTKIASHHYSRLRHLHDQGCHE